MAYKDQTITNLSTGQTIRFLQTAKDTNHEFLEIEAAYDAHSKPPPPHYHPYQEEDFVIVKGEMELQMGDKTITLHEGDCFHIPANTVHSMWNNSGSLAIVNWKTRPALDTQYFLEAVTDIANQKVDNNEHPSALLKSLMEKYSNTFRVSKFV